MIPAPTPADEAERMAELQALRILDTPPEDRFNRIIRLAKGILQVPIAYIALVDRDRQWFKAKCGVTVDQTGREESFCGHAILQKEPLVIPDARRDPRFHDNPLVLGPPHVRFYAGHPLQGPQGHNVGTLCVVSPEPRELSQQERVLLGELAAMAEHELSLIDVIESQRELLQTKQALIESQQHLADELAQAESYVRSLLPEKLRGAITSDYQFVSSSQLGGDIFGYHWLDEHQLAIYLLDVCGHGVGSALLSVSVQHALRSHALPNVRFDQPHEVLTALNQAFPMEEHDGRFFTIWYGVYDQRSRQLRYASGGHPPAILLDAAGNETRLGCANLIVGVAADTTYEVHEHAIPVGARLYLFSDGVYEAELASGELLGLDGLVQLLRTPGRDTSHTRFIYDVVCRQHGSSELVDDFSLVEFRFHA